MDDEVHVDLRSWRLTKGPLTAILYRAQEGQFSIDIGTSQPIDSHRIDLQNADRYTFPIDDHLVALDIAHRLLKAEYELHEKLQAAINHWRDQTNNVLNQVKNESSEPAQ